MSISLQSGLNRRAHRELSGRIDRTLLRVSDRASTRARRKVMEKAIRKAYGRHVIDIEHAGDRLYSVILAPRKGSRGQWLLTLSEYRPDGTEHVYPLVMFTDHAAARMRQADVDMRNVAQGLAATIVNHPGAKLSEELLIQDGFLAIKHDGDVPVVVTFVCWSAMSPAKARALQAKYRELKS